MTKTNVNKKENETKKESNSLNNVISFLIAICVIGGIIYFVYTNFIKISEAPVKQAKNEKNNQKEIDDLANKKYYWLSNQTDPNDFSYVFFKNKTVDYNNIEPENVLTIAYHSISSNDRLNGSKCKEKSINCTEEVFSKGVLKEQIDNNFTSKVKVNYTDFKATGSYYCKYDGEYYTCDKQELNTDFNHILSFNEFVKAEMKDDKLLVYSTIIFIKASYAHFDENERGVYGSDLNNKIGDTTEFEKIEKDLSKENVHNLINYYRDKLPIYKSTFILENGNYVWEKTEIE